MTKDRGAGRDKGAAIHVRPESAADAGAIRDLTFAAFRGMPYADGDEHVLVDRLREAGALTVSLVAEREGRVVGHVAFSPADAEGWYALGPVSVLPAHQRRGIGSSLIRAGLAALGNARGCILVGDPKVYERFGFELAPDLAPPGMPAAYFMLKLMRGPRPERPVAFHEAFSTPPDPPTMGPR